MRFKSRFEEIYAMMIDPVDADEEILPDETARELIQFMTDWGNTSGRRDLVALDAMLPDDLVLTMYDGRVINKTQYLELVKTLPGDYRITDYDQTAQTYPHTAIIRAAYKLESGNHQMRLRYTATFIKRAENWHIVAFHSNALG